MKAEAKCTIHNRFDIEVRDSITGELKQSAQAFNIVLDQMYTRLCNLTTFFVNIHFGTGTGTLAPARTTLFTYLGTKTAVDETLVKALPISSRKRKIVLNPEEFVGSVLSEVGIAYGATASYLVTHAMLQDSEGNPITITKTALDVVTIYATVYFTFATQDSSIKLCGMPTYNPLINYLVSGTTFPEHYFYLGEGNQIGSEKTNAISSMPELGATSYVAIADWVKDVVNKKITTPVKRFGVTVGNGHAGEIGFGSSVILPLFRASLPITGVFTGQSYAAVPVATGDGVTRDFLLPSRNIRQSTIGMKLDGSATSAYVKTLVARALNFKRYVPEVIPAGGGNWADLSADGMILAVAHGSSPYITTYDWIGGAWIKRANPVVLPAGSATGCSLSADGSVLAVAHGNSPYFSTYDWTEGAWVKRANPAVLLTGAADCSLSTNGLILAVAHSGSPYVTAYDWTAGAWVKRANPAVLPAGNPFGCSLSADGLVLALVHNGSPYITTYDWTAGAWVKRANPAVLPTVYCNRCSVSADGLILALACSGTPYVLTYDWTAGAWVKRPDPAVLPTSNTVGCFLSADGSVLSVIFNNSPYAMIYDWINSAWVKRPDPAVLPVSNSYAGALSDNGLVLAIPNYNNPFIATYDLSKRQTLITFDTAPGAGVAITADYTVDGVHKTDQYVIDVGLSIQFGEVV